MSLANPMTITDVYRRHGMTTAVTAPVLQLKELAMAVSLQGRYHATTNYHGGAHQLRVTVRQAPAAGMQNHDGLCKQLALIEIPLPREGRPAPEAGNQLGAAIQRLTAYLMEGQPS